MTDTFGLVCEHGSLARSCVHCELAEEIKRADALEKDNAMLLAMLRDVCNQAPYINGFTIDMIESALAKREAAVKP